MLTIQHETFRFYLDVVDYLTTLGKVDLASLSKEAEDTRVKLLQELIEILSGSPDGLLNGGEANGEPVPEVVPDDFAEDYEVPTSTLQRNTQLVEPDRESTASIEKKESKSAIVHSKSNTDMKKKKGLTRMKSSQVVELPDKDKRKKEGNLIEKKLMRRTVQHWAVLSADTLYLAKNSEERHSELKVNTCMVLCLCMLLKPYYQGTFLSLCTTCHEIITSD